MSIWCIQSHLRFTGFMLAKWTLSFCCLNSLLFLDHCPYDLTDLGYECSLEHECLMSDKPLPMAITTWPIFFIACESHIVLQCPLLSTTEITLCSREVEDLRRTRNSQQLQSVTTYFNPKLRDHETVTKSALCVPTPCIQDISPFFLPPSFDILHWRDMHLMYMD